MTPKPLFKRIDTVFLPVKDLQKAIKWYTAVLEFELLWVQGPVACFKVGETPLTLLQYKFPGFEQPPEPGFNYQWVEEVPFNFYAEDIQEARRKLVAHGGSASEIVDHGDVMEFTFEDLDGNRLGVCWWSEGE